jgi:hypothetical protein
VTVYIYALADPNTGQIRYVGKTIEPRRRFATHCRGDKADVHSHRARWIAKLKANGLKPVLHILETVEDARWQEAECKWIAFYRSTGCDLVNSTDGGDGGHNPPPDVREKISRTHKGRKFSESHRSKIGAAHKGRVFSPDSIAKMSHSRIGNSNCVGRKLSEETKRKIGAAQLGRKQSPEEIEKKRLASLGRKHSPESRVRMSEIRKRIWEAKKNITQGS